MADRFAGPTPLHLRQAPCRPHPGGRGPKQRWCPPSTVILSRTNGLHLRDAHCCSGNWFLARQQLLAVSNPNPSATHPSESFLSIRLRPDFALFSRGMLMGLSTYLVARGAESVPWGRFFADLLTRRAKVQFTQSVGIAWFRLKQSFCRRRRGGGWSTWSG